jgi:hypothetical protein
MKKLKIAAFVSVALYFALHVVCEFLIVIEFNGMFTNFTFVLKQYEMLAQYVAVPLMLIYLYKRLK